MARLFDEYEPQPLGKINDYKLKFFERKRDPRGEKALEINLFNVISFKTH